MPLAASCHLQLHFLVVLPCTANQGALPYRRHACQDVQQQFPGLHLTASLNKEAPKIQSFGVIAPSLGSPLSPACQFAFSPSLPATLSAIALPARTGPFADESFGFKHPYFSTCGQWAASALQRCRLRNSKHRARPLSEGAGA